MSALQPALLVVEDDDSIREAVSMLLSGEGFTIVAARSGEEALAVIAGDDTLAGLYTDIDLPGSVDGWMVGSSFRARWPGKPIVYASGTSHQQGRMVAGAVFLPKPFSADTMIAGLLPN